MFRAPRGTRDILPEQWPHWNFIEETAKQVASRFGYSRIDTPLFEDARLFARGIGEVTDILEKETYTFDDRGGDSLTLRPEGTAPVCRAYLEHGMFNLPQPVRLYYFCPVFRYERPQAGRYRQHHQFGVETFGDISASVDAEIIELAISVLKGVGLNEFTLLINSIGDLECRPTYLKQLQKYYKLREKELCSDCKVRLYRSPLRLLDCKQDSCQPIANEAPRNIDYLCDQCQEHWEQLLGYLKEIRVEYQVDHRLVRGFDYYTRTVFEVQPIAKGSQTALCGGGRYDGLIEELGGKPTPGIGFGMGIERLVLMLQQSEHTVLPTSHPSIMIICLGSDAINRGVALTSSLRLEGISAVLAPPNRSIRGQMRYASSMESEYTAIIGEDELEKGIVTLRNMATSEQYEIKMDIPSLISAIGK